MLKSKQVSYDFIMTLPKSYSVGTPPEEIILAVLHEVNIPYASKFTISETVQILTSMKILTSSKLVKIQLQEIINKLQYPELSDYSLDFFVHSCICTLRDSLGYHYN